MVHITQRFSAVMEYDLKNFEDSFSSLLSLRSFWVEKQDQRQHFWYSINSKNSSRSLVQELVEKKKLHVIHFNMIFVILSEQPPEEVLVNFGGMVVVGHVDREYLDGVKRFFRLLLIFVLLVPFETVFNVHEYLFQLQASEMKYPPWNLIDEVSTLSMFCSKLHDRIFKLECFVFQKFLKEIGDRKLFTCPTFLVL